MITKQTKIHLISLSVAAVLIGVMYLLLSSSDQAPSAERETESKYLIMVEGATYGENCHAFIEHNNRIRARAKPPRPHLTPIQQNNALRLISKTCSGQPTCKLYITPQTMEFDPAPNCAKELRIHYRCFSFDSEREAVGRDGKEMTLNCEL